MGAAGSRATGRDAGRDGGTGWRDGMALGSMLRVMGPLAPGQVEGGSGRDALVRFAKDVRAAYHRLWLALPKRWPVSKVGPAGAALSVAGQAGARGAAESAPVDRWRMVAGLDPSLPWVKELAAHYGEGASFPGSISPEAGLLLHALVRNARPRVVVEVGSFLGASTVWLGSGLEEGAGGGVLHAVDRFAMTSRYARSRPDVPRDVRGAFDARIARAGLGGVVRGHAGESVRTLLSLRKELIGAGGVGLAFIDGDHTIPGVFQDFWAIEPALAPGALVVFHDTRGDTSGHEGPGALVAWLRGQMVGGGMGREPNGAGGSRPRFEIAELPIAPIDFGLVIARLTRAE